MRLRRVRTADLRDGELTALRELFAAAWPNDRFDEHDLEHSLGGRHVLLEVRGRIASHAAVVPRSLETARRRFATGYVEAMATWPEFEHRGYGTMVLRAAGEHIRSEYELGALDTSKHAFYERLGWERWRGPTSVRTAGGLRATPEEDGCVMILRTPVTPRDLDLDAPISCEWREGEVW